MLFYDFFEWYFEKTHCKLLCGFLEALMIIIERAQKDEIFILNCFPSSSGKVLSKHPTQLLAFSVESVSWFCCPVLCCTYYQYDREDHKTEYEGKIYGELAWYVASSHFLWTAPCQESGKYTGPLCKESVKMFT